VSGASLDFYPYYVFEYKIDISKNDPSGKKHNLQNQDVVIVNAFNGKLLLSEKKRTKFMNKLNPFLSKKNAGLVPSGIAERNQIIIDLRNIEPIRNLKLQSTGDYAINLIDNKVSLAAVEKAVLRDIISNNTMKISYEKKRLKVRLRNKKCGLFLDVTK
jgi:hypothetical protein